uniref:Uncharacterized protein n=1 Tax=Anguilla anguilla TaxID=7936 RepID=A0A0E9Q717_ANGAN
MSLIAYIYIQILIVTYSLQTQCKNK